MTKLLEQAFAAVSRLPDAEQDVVASRLLEDIDAEAKWDAIFEATADGLSTLAAQALSEFRAGKTSPQLDDDRDLSND